MKFPTLSRKLGHQLVALRQRKGLTQAQLSRLSGISLKYISMVESGSNPSLKTLLRLCAALEVEAEEMVEKARSMRIQTGKKPRVSPLNVDVPTGCPVFRSLVKLIRDLDRDKREQALEIIRAL